MLELRGGSSALLLAAALCGFALAGCGHQGARKGGKKVLAITGERYVSEAGGFSLNYPKGWASQETGAGSNTVHIFNGPISHGDAITLIVECPQTPSTTALVAANKKTLADVDGLNIEGETPVTVGGEPGVQLKMHHRATAGNMVVDVEQFEVYAAHNGKGCVLTYTVPSSNIGMAEDDFADIVSTVKWDGATAGGQPAQ